jgi:hypothetical protein
VTRWEISQLVIDYYIVLLFHYTEISRAIIPSRDNKFSQAFRTVSRVFSVSLFGELPDAPVLSTVLLLERV